MAVGSELGKYSLRYLPVPDHTIAAYIIEVLAKKKCVARPKHLHSQCALAHQGSMLA